MLPMQIDVAIVLFVFMCFLSFCMCFSHLVKRRSNANRLTRDGNVVHALVRAASALVPTPAC
jgi:hypothetical protein